MATKKRKPREWSLFIGPGGMCAVNEKAAEELEIVFANDDMCEIVHVREVLEVTDVVV